MTTFEHCLNSFRNKYFNRDATLQLCQSAHAFRGTFFREIAFLTFGMMWVGCREDDKNHVI